MEAQPARPLARTAAPDFWAQLSRPLPEGSLPSASAAQQLGRSKRPRQTTSRTDADADGSNSEGPPVSNADSMLDRAKRLQEKNVGLLALLAACTLGR